eukprot:5584779-Amphidinium_carterae.1
MFDCAINPYHVPLPFFEGMSGYQSEIFQHQGPKCRPGTKESVPTRKDVIFDLGRKLIGMAPARCPEYKGSKRPPPPQGL